MLRLILVRHAKSAWDNPGIEDFARPLARRGQLAARWVGSELVSHGGLAERVLCSPAARAKETLEIAMAHLHNRSGVEVLWEKRVYDHRDDDYVELLREAGGAALSIMIVGHNPATADTATSLIGEDVADAFADLVSKYPTGAIAIIEFDAAEWREVQPGTGRLTHFACPPRG